MALAPCPLLLSPPVPVCASRCTSFRVGCKSYRDHARRIVPVPIAYIAGDWLPDCSAGLELKNGMPEAGCCMRVRFASSGSRFGARATRFRHCEEQKERSKPRCTVFPPSSRTLQSAHASRGLSSSMCGGVNRRIANTGSSLRRVLAGTKSGPKRAAEPLALREVRRRELASKIMQTGKGGMQ